MGVKKGKKVKVECRDCHKEFIGMNKEQANGKFQDHKCNPSQKKLTVFESLTKHFQDIGKYKKITWKSKMKVGGITG